jgi:hypothetical protein
MTVYQQGPRLPRFSAKYNVQSAEPHELSWLYVDRPRLGTHPHVPLYGPGIQNIPNTFGGTRLHTDGHDGRKTRTILTMFLIQAGSY